MVSLRCKMIVKEELLKMGFHSIFVHLGEIEIIEDITQLQRDELKTNLLKCGLELMDDKRAILIQQIKNIIIEMVHYEEDLPKVNFSDFLSEKLHYNYTYLANLFSETEGITIEHFIILHKVERVKELIMYNELNITEISYLLHYSSVAHLSNQFKKITGLTPSFFKSIKEKKRTPIEDV